MASVTTSCAPCVFSASTTLLSFPYSVIQTFTVQVIPQVIVRNGTSITTGAITTTLDEPVVAESPTGVGGPVIVTFTDPSQITWSTLGTILTYPTTYVEYLGFDGASATSSGCAAGITPTAMPLPSNVVSASLIYPSNDTTAGLPPGLVGYLDSLPGFTAQLGEPVNSCANSIPAPPPSSTASTSQPSSTVVNVSPSTTTTSQATSTVASTSSAITSVTSSPSSSAVTTATSTTASSSSASPVSTSVSTVTQSDTTTTLSPSTTITSTSYSTKTSTLTSSITLASTAPIFSLLVPPPSTTTTITSTVASSANTAPQTFAPSTAHVFSTVTINPVISQSGSVTTLSTTLSAVPTALPISVPSSVSVGLGGFLSYINSLTASTTPRASGSTTSKTTTLTTSVVPHITGTGSSSVLVGPLTGTLSGTPYRVINATSTTYALLNGTSTTHVIPYTGRAAPGARPVGAGLLECLIGLALPAVLL
ncbi:hypothetical protein LTR35_008376 [Friedmanniomyces endolithicus]|uniref:Uncharacterized protein n=1 Tax=Friedmanniomyces endolithicus TaxID=329885 RepID=A0AAN6FQJ0_9PEZI|nr:hypothetical protein LTR35_008376 [Friedmanniomyces endolithicus]KAK0294873.1 hypothetical protein LTS00_006708 [Friedmanniomyces endolithicus]KAK0320943.1 hypothetical protein LTR82_007860 [Friedmanniomyces endolithicus]KAK1002134.1 hypothetical protein LTR54_008146 [Friedmanniomyces endolithicus]